MIVVVNEHQLDVDDHVTVAALLESLGYPDKGVAVALDSSVLPRAHWSTRLCELSGLSGVAGPVRLEVVTAVQGG